jgi:hypothetical protein
MAHGCFVRAVDWDLLVVGAESVAVGVGVVQQSTDEHLIIAWFDSRD